MLETWSRRRFFVSAAGLVAGSFGLPMRARGEKSVLQAHPEPRPDVDGSLVLSGDALGGDSRLIELFDGIREIPHIADGIACYCGCASVPGYRSLLSCFEGSGMAMHCQVCQGEAGLALRRHAEGRSLDEIRRAIDARFGNG